MSKIYAHTPVKALVRDFLAHLNTENKALTEAQRELDFDYSALILSPIEETKSFRQVFPAFIKKLSKKFKSLLKKEKDSASQVSWSWDEDLVIVLESLEDFINLRWKVRFHRTEDRNTPEIADFKTAIISLGISEDIYVSFELLTKKQDNTFEFNAVGNAVEEIIDGNDEAVGELVIEEISPTETEKDKELERQRKAEEDKKIEEEFLEFKTHLEKKIQELTKLYANLKWRQALNIAGNILTSLGMLKTNKRDHAIYLTERKIEVSVLLASVHLSNENAAEAKGVLTPLLAVAKRGTVDTYVDLLVLLGDAEFLLDDFEESMKAYSMCLSTKKQFTKEEKMLINAKRAKTAIKFEEEDGIGYVSMTAEEGMKYMKYILENTKPGEELYSYSAVAVADYMFRIGQIGNAAHTCLIALVADSSNEDLRKQFVRFMQAHAQLVTAIIEMFANIPTQPKEGEDGQKSDTTANSIGFLGSLLKEHSAVSQAETFIVKSCELTDYTAPDIILSHLHLIELSKDFGRVLVQAQQYLDKSLDQGIDFTIPANIVSSTAGLPEILGEVTESPKYSELLKRNVDGSYVYSLTNKMFLQPFKKIKEIMDCYRSTFDIDFGETDFSLGENVKMEKKLIKATEGEENRDDTDPFAPSNKCYSNVVIDGDVHILSRLSNILAESEIRNSLAIEPRQLQVLAIYFTLIKIIFQMCPLPQLKFPRAGGKDAFPHVYKIISMIEPIRVVGKDLHLTPVRNEQAYYSMICQLLPFVVENRNKYTNLIKQSEKFNFYQLKIADMEKAGKRTQGLASYMTVVEDSIDKIYVLGDSHALPLSWQVFSKKNADAADFNVDKDLNLTELVPVLATGVKAWHLREESTFYPKYNFYESANYIKRHWTKFKARQQELFEHANAIGLTQERLDFLEAQKPKVVFIFCEIDCREGMVIALERGKYDSLEAAAEAIVDIYLGVLKKIVSKYGFHVYVHPVLPVMDVTRPIVNAFNAILEKKSKALEEKLGKDTFTWLEVLDKVTVSEEEGVKEEFKLDGTHINARYIELIKDQLLD